MRREGGLGVYDLILFNNGLATGQFQILDADAQRTGAGKRGKKKGWAQQCCAPTRNDTRGRGANPGDPDDPDVLV